MAVQTRVFQKISKGVEKRLVGNLQSNKIKKAVALFDSIDSVGSYSLAQKISKYCQKTGKTQRILIQINTSEEKTKNGFLLSEKKEILKCFSLPNLQVDGLMTIGPLTDNQNKRKKAFQSLKDFFSMVIPDFPQSCPVGLAKVPKSSGFPLCLWSFSVKIPKIFVFLEFVGICLQREMFVTFL